MLRKYLSILLVFAAILTASCERQIDDPVENIPAEELYSASALAIYDKIAELEKAKALALQYKTEHNLIDDNGDTNYLALLDEANAVRDELIDMGAKPSAEELAALNFEGVQVNGVLIDDFASFEEPYGSVYDLWGVSQTVNASYGTYYTYDIMIQDIAGGTILSTSIFQNNRPGWELYITGSSLSSLLTDEINSAAFDRIVECAVSGTRSAKEITGAHTALKSLWNMISPSDPITVSGNTKSYVIYCDIVPTVHFVFVRDSTDGAWQHSLTTNTATVVEKHTWYFVISQNGRPVIVNSSDSPEAPYTYEKILIPEDYAYRLTNAISAYRYNRSIYTDILSGYTIVVEAGTADITEEEVFTLSITCPEDQFDLFRYALQ